MLTRIGLQKLAKLRLEDSIFLLNAGKPSSAYYLAGYSVELAIKACISKLFQNDTIPDKSFVNTIYTHKLDTLMSASGLQPELNKEIKANSQFAANWGIVTKWNESSRYDIWDQITATTLIYAIQDQQNGVFQWIVRYW